MVHSLECYVLTFVLIFLYIFSTYQNNFLKDKKRSKKNIQCSGIAILSQSNQLTTSILNYVLILLVHRTFVGNCKKKFGLQSKNIPRGFFTLVPLGSITGLCLEPLIHNLRMNRSIWGFSLFRRSMHFTISKLVLCILFL